MRKERGFSTVGLMLVGAGGFLAALGVVPRSQQARIATSEAVTIADLRDIVAAARAYQASNGALPWQLSCLGEPVASCGGATFPAGTHPFLDPLRGAVPAMWGVISDNSFLSHGYVFVYARGPVSGYGVFDPGVKSFTLIASPVVVSGSGQRYFIVDHTGAICASTTAPFLNDGVGVPAGCTKV